MHTVGLHSALAIKRQRKRREEQKRAKERRYSTHSNNSTPRNSIVSLDGAKFTRSRAASKKPNLLSTKVVTSVGMLHIGVVFLVFGLFLIVSAILPATDEDASLRTKKDLWNELLYSGIFCLCLGILLIILNRIVSKKADEDLNDYVTHQLNRSKSGQRLVRDAETGHHQTTQSKRYETKEELLTNGEVFQEDSEPAAVFHTPSVHIKSPISSPPPCMNGEPPLEKIVEEDSISIASSRPKQRFFSEEKGEEDTRVMESFNKETMSNDSTTASLSPGTPSETQELLTSRSLRMYRM